MIPQIPLPEDNLFPFHWNQRKSSKANLSLPVGRNPFKWSLRRQITTISACGAISGVLYYLQTILPLWNSPSPAQSLLLFQPASPLTAEIDEYIRTHPIAQTLRADSSYTESRPHLRLPEALRQHSLTAGALAGPGRIVVPPLAFCDDTRGKLVSLAFLGEDLCGHIGLVHGGLLATLMDESLGRCGLAALPKRIGVTANLTVNFRKPVKAGSYVVMKAEVVKTEGRKVWVKGRIEELGDGKGEGKGEGDLLVEAEALFIQPKNLTVCQS